MTDVSQPRSAQQSKHITDASISPSQAVKREKNLIIWQAPAFGKTIKENNLTITFTTKSPLKHGATCIVFKLDLIVPNLDLKKKKKKDLNKFLQERRQGCRQAQGLVGATSPSAAVEASWTSSWLAAGSSGADDWVASSAAISWSTTSKSRLCKSTPEGCLTR